MSWYGSVGRWATSPSGQATIGAAGNAASNYANNRADRAMTKEEMAQHAAELAMQDRFSRDQTMTGAAPTGWSQNYQQGNMIKQMLLGKLTGGQAQSGFVPSNPELAQRLSNRPGMQVPAEWNNVNPFGVGQTMDSIAQRQQVLDRASGGVTPSLNFSNYGIDPQLAARLQAQTGAYNKDVTGERANLLSAIGMADPMTGTPDTMQARNSALLATQNNNGGGGEHHYTKTALGFADPMVAWGLLKNLFKKGKDKNTPTTPTAPGGGGENGGVDRSGIVGYGGNDLFRSGVGDPTAPPGRDDQVMASLQARYRSERHGGETFEQWFARTHATQPREPQVIDN